jgi:hypothetical protein
MLGMGIFVAFAIGLFAIVLFYRLSASRSGVEARHEVEIEEALAVTRGRLRSLLHVIVAEHPEIAGLNATELHLFCRRTVESDRRFQALFIEFPPSVVAGVQLALRRSEALVRGLRSELHQRSP